MDCLERDCHGYDHQPWHPVELIDIVNADVEMTRYRCRCPAILSVEMGSESVSQSVW